MNEPYPTFPYPSANHGPTGQAALGSADLGTIATRHYRIPCGVRTEHEREATLPAQYRSGDPDYEDKSKCGRCGEMYQCQECGAPWDVERNGCAAVLEHGHHGPEKS